MTIQHMAKNGLHFGFGETQEEADNAARGIGAGAITLKQEQWDLIVKFVTNGQLAIKNQEIEVLKAQVAKLELESDSPFAVLHVVGSRTDSEHYSILRRVRSRYEVHIPDAGSAQVASKLVDFLTKDFVEKLNDKNASTEDAYCPGTSVFSKGENDEGP